MYAPAALHGRFTGGAGSGTARDNRVASLSQYLLAAGWSLRKIGSEFEFTTTADMSLSIALAGTSTYIFWKVTNTLNNTDVLVGDISRPDLAVLTTHGEIVVGSTARAAVHQGVVAAILLLFPGWTAMSVDPFTTRFSTDEIRNAAIPVGSGASLNSGATSGISQRGGYVCRCQPSRLTVLKNGLPANYGADNWFELYIYQGQIGPNVRVWFSGAKQFPGRPYDALTVTPGTTSYSPDDTQVRRMVDGTLEPGGGGNPSLGELWAWATAYGIVLYDLSYDSFLNCQALKLFDGRTLPSQDLPVTEATLIAYSTSGTVPGKGLHNRSFITGIQRYCMNNRAVYIQDQGQPGMFVEGVCDLANAQPVNGIPWVDGSYPLKSCWLGWNVFNAAGRRPMLGQWWDAALSYEYTDDPRNSPIFTWDPNQPWRRVSRSAGSSSNRVSTFLHRETGFWSGA